MKKRFSIFVLILVVVLGSALLLTSCGGKDIHKNGDTDVEVTKAEFGPYGMMYEGKYYEAKYYTDGGYIKLAGSKPDKMEIVDAKGHITKLSLKDIESKIKVDNENISIIGISDETEDGMFQDFESLTEVDLTKFNASDSFNIPAYCFADCANLTTVKLPTNISAYGNTIGKYAFTNCPKLSSVTGLNKFDNFENNVFTNCQALTTIDLPEKMVVVSDSAFENCTKLATVNFSNSVEVIGFSAFSNTSVTNVDFSKMANLKIIKPSAFYKAKLTKVVLPDTIVSVGARAFNNNPLKVVDIPFISSFDSRNVSFNEYYGFNPTLNDVPIDYEVPTVAVTIRKATGFNVAAFSAINGYAGNIESLAITFVEDGMYDYKIVDDPMENIILSNKKYVTVNKAFGVEQYANQPKLTSVTVNGEAREIPAPPAEQVQ